MAIAYSIPKQKRKINFNKNDEIPDPCYYEPKFK